MCDSCNWEHYLNMADEMIEDRRFEFAYDVIDGIQIWVSKNEHITDRQAEALENIYGSKR